MATYWDDFGHILGGFGHILGGFGHILGGLPLGYWMGAFGNILGGVRRASDGGLGTATNWAG